jgi:hypothetical protein
VESTDNYLTDKIKYFNTNKTDDYTWLVNRLLFFV